MSSQQISFADLAKAIQQRAEKSSLSVSQPKALQPKRRVASPANVIPTPQIIEEIKDYLLFHSGKYGYRNYIIFLLGINVGRRCGDLLALHVSDVYQNGKVVDHITQLVESKTGKRITLYLSDDVREELRQYIYANMLHHYPSSYLFPSQKGHNAGHLSTKSYWRIMNDVENTLQLNFHISTHAMRKTFARYRYDYMVAHRDEYKVDPLVIMQKILGHSSQQITIDYLDLTKEDIQKAMTSITL